MKTRQNHLLRGRAGDRDLRVLRPLLVIPTGIAVAVLLFVQFGAYVPNLLGLHDRAIANSQLIGIAGILASILGIVIAIQLVALEFLRRLYSHYGFASIFRDPQLVELVVLYTVTTIAAVLLSGRLNDPLTNTDVAMCHLVFLLFLISMVILFPSCNGVIGETHSRQRIVELVQRIDEDTIREIRPHPIHEQDINQTNIAFNPVYVLGQAVTRFIQDDDRVSAQFTVIAVTERLVGLLAQSSDRRHTISGVLSIFLRSTTAALKEQDEGTLRVIIDSLTRIHRFCAANHYPWHEMIELNDALQHIASDCIKSGPETASRLCFWRLAAIMQEHLKHNCPKQEDIWEFTDNYERLDKDDSDTSLQWDHVGRGFIFMVSDLIDSAIGIKKEDAAGAGLRALLSMTRDSLRLANLGDKQKAALVNWEFYHARTLTIHSIDEGFRDQMALLGPFSSFDISGMLDDDRSYARVALVDFGQFMIDAATRKALKAFTMNELGAIARCATRRAPKSEINRGAVLFAIDVFDRLRSIYQSPLAEASRREYLECFTQMESVRRWLNEHAPDQEPLLAHCDAALGRFADLDAAREAVKHSSAEWPQVADHSSGK